MSRLRPRFNRDAILAWAVPLAVGLLTFLTFVPALHNGFVSWDDRANFVENPHYRGLGPTQLAWMWTTFRLGHYVPLTWMTLGFDYLLWGMNPAGYHLTNILLHSADAVLVYFVGLRLLRMATASTPMPAGQVLPAAVAALLFAIHPLRVESVAWVTERRDVLSLLFFLAAILAYLTWRERSRRRWYWIAFAAFACALLSKATAMTLPAVLLILNVYPHKRLGVPGHWRDVEARHVYTELAPFALLSACTVVLSIVALSPPDQLGAGAKVAVSAYSLAFYLWKTISPSHLSPLYEMPPHVDPGAAIYVASYVAAITLSAAAWAVRHRWPAVTTAWAIFLVISLPMLGVVQNGPQIAADRYTYHAAPALAILAGAALFWARRSATFTLVRGIVGVGVLFVLGALTWSQNGVWRNSESLWGRVLALDSGSSIGHSAMASLLFQQNRLDDAIAQSERAVALAPNYAEAHNDLGVGSARDSGRFADAVVEYERAIAIKPRYDEAHNNLGVVIGHQGNLDSAMMHYREALSINPDNADAHVNWGNALVRSGDPGGAIVHYTMAIHIRPDHADAHFNWGVALARQGRLPEAIEQFRIVLSLDPGHVEAKNYLERATQQLTGSRL